MKVALVNPPWRCPGHYGVRAGSRWPHFERNSSRYMPYPFFLGYTAALLERDGFAVAIFDGCATKETDEAYLEQVREFAPDLIIQENATASIGVDLAWASRLKCATAAFLLMTGHHVPHLVDRLAELRDVDALAGGEFEFTALETAQRLRRAENLDGVLGLVHRGADGRAVSEPRRPNLTDLDELPFPHRSSLDMRLYHDNPGDLPDPCLQLLGSRGCPYHCNFCVWPQVVYGDHRYRPRSATNICDELESVLRSASPPYRSYYFDDDTFNIGDRRLCELADQIIQRGLEQFPWGAMCRSDTMSRETLSKLRRAGLHAVKYGIESGSQALVDRSGKKLDLAQVRSMVAYTHELGIKTHLTFSFGLVGETRETMRETLAFALQLDPHTVQFSICTPFPGTAFYEYAREHDLLLNDDFSAYDGMSRCVVRADEVSAEELEDFVVHAGRVWDEHVSERGALWRRVVRRPWGTLRVALTDPGRAARFAKAMVSRHGSARRRSSS